MARRSEHSHPVGDAYRVGRRRGRNGDWPTWPARHPLFLIHKHPGGNRRHEHQLGEYQPLEVIAS
jgi:hypothetical protein